MIFKTIELCRHPCHTKQSARLTDGCNIIDVYVQSIRINSSVVKHSNKVEPLVHFADLLHNCERRERFFSPARCNLIT